jgi:hypothetical protein
MFPDNSTMGTLYDFNWESCGYEAEVFGGEDCGIAPATTTIICADRKELYDVQSAMTW